MEPDTQFMDNLPVISIELQIAVFEQLHKFLVTEHDRCSEGYFMRSVYKDRIGQCLAVLEHLNNLKENK